MPEKSFGMKSLWHPRLPGIVNMRTPMTQILIYTPSRYMRDIELKFCILSKFPFPLISHLRAMSKLLFWKMKNILFYLHYEINGCYTY